MEVSVWEKNRGELSHYNRREPTETPLYKILYNYKDEFEYRYEELFEQEYGFLRGEVLEAFDAYLNCGILRHGCARAVCENCKHSQLIAFSCKKRGICPSCAAKRAHIFAENLHENVLLLYPHRHLVFTIPKRLRVYFKFDHKLSNILFCAANKAWSTYIASKIGEGRVGCVMSLHTAGDLLNYHPHIHAIVLDGTISETETFLPLETIDVLEIEKLFSRHIFKELLSRELLDPDAVENMKTWEHSGFSVWCGEDIGSAEEEKRLFISRYLTKPPISLKRMELINEELYPTIRYYKDENKLEFKDFSPLKLLAELSQHIPYKWEQQTRFYGTYSCKTRGAKKRKQELERKLTPLEFDIQESSTPSRYWATWIKKVYEINPLACPKCKGEMKIIAFLHDPKEIAKICNNLGLSDWRAPPKFQKLAA